MRQAAIAPTFPKTTRNSIHLVKGSGIAAEAFATPAAHALWEGQRKFSESATKLAFAGLAVVAPLVWLGHALLVRLNGR